MANEEECINGGGMRMNANFMKIKNFIKRVISDCKVSIKVKFLLIDFSFALPRNYFICKII